MSEARIVFSEGEFYRLLKCEELPDCSWTDYFWQIEEDPKI